MNKPVSFASASDTREQKPQLRELAPNVYGYISDFDPNCGFVVGDDHVVPIDRAWRRSPASPSRA